MILPISTVSAWINTSFNYHSRLLDIRSRYSPLSGGKYFGVHDHSRLFHNRPLHLMLLSALPVFLTEYRTLQNGLPHGQRPAYHYFSVHKRQSDFVSVDPASIDQVRLRGIYFYRNGTAPPRLLQPSHDLGVAFLVKDGASIAGLTDLAQTESMASTASVRRGRFSEVHRGLSLLMLGRILGRDDADVRQRGFRLR